MKARITSLVAGMLLAGLLPGCAFVSRVANPGGSGALQGGALQYCHLCVTIAP